MKIDFLDPAQPLEAGTALAVPAFAGERLAGPLAELDLALGGAAGRAIGLGKFEAKSGQLRELLAPSGLPVDRILIVGCGEAEDFGPAAAESFAAYALQALKSSGSKTLRLRLGPGAPELAAQAAFGARLASYRFDRYKTKEAQDRGARVDRVEIETSDPKAAKKAYADLDALADGVEFTRDLVSEPANILHPEEFARRVKKLDRLGLEVEILGEKEMKKLGMGALLGVGQGSVRESQLVVLTWRGGEDDAAPLAFIGKGVCFDTGGISLKPADGMEDMKWDMAGAGAVAGLMCALAGRKAKANVVGILGLVENMPDGAAQRPGDIVVSMSGQTVEVINTDAEGRMVLADALWYTQDRFKPQFMVDLATLTGAIIVSLGHDYGGLFCNDDVLADRLAAAGVQEGELLWRMPLRAAYEKQLDSAAADMKHVGGRPAGSITAALFLQKFTNGVPWAHLDIAATAWRKPSAAPTVPEGASGFGVRLLDRLVRDHYEG